MKSLWLATIAALSFATALADDELDIARQALRDGVWAVARDHALRAGGDEGRLVVLESYARESRWSDILSTLASWENPEGEGFACYRAMALARTDERDEARRLLDGVEFKDPDLARMAKRIKAGAFLADGKPSDALKALKDYDSAASFFSAFCAALSASCANAGIMNKPQSAIAKIFFMLERE